MLVEKVRVKGKMDFGFEHVFSVNILHIISNMKLLCFPQVAAESRSVLLAVTPSAVLSKWSGESEKTIRDIFAAASAMQPSIVFIVGHFGGIRV